MLLAQSSCVHGWKLENEREHQCLVARPTVQPEGTSLIQGQFQSSASGAQPRKRALPYRTRLWIPLLLNIGIHEATNLAESRPVAEESASVAKDAMQLHCGDESFGDA